MGQGILTITSVATVAATSPTEYDATCVSTSGVTVGDHVSAELSDGTDAVYYVVSISSPVLRLRDSLTEGNVASGSPAEFGQPAAGSAAYGTPLGTLLMTMLPEGARGWRAANQRNDALMSGGIARGVLESGGATLTMGALADTEFLVRSGTTIVGSAGAVATHKDTHKSGGSDPFTSADLLEASVKRLYENSGPTTLTIGALADGSYLKRVGTALIGDTPASAAVLQQTNGGRLTAHASLATGEESSGVDALNYLAHTGDYVAVYDGSSAWSYKAISSGVSFDASADNDMDAAAIAVDTNYDVFVWDNGGALELALKKWTNSTTRATALVKQNGVWVLTGSTTHRYLGTVRTVDVSSAPKFVDHDRRRYVWNYDNRLTRRNQTGVSSPTSYNTSAAGAQTLNNADYDGYHHSFVVGIESHFSARMPVLTFQSAATSQYLAYIYLDGAAASAGETASTTLRDPATSRA